MLQPVGSVYRFLDLVFGQMLHALGPKSEKAKELMDLSHKNWLNTCMLPCVRLNVHFRTIQRRSEYERCYIWLLGPMNINFCLGPGRGWTHKDSLPRGLGESRVLPEVLGHSSNNLTGY